MHDKVWSSRQSTAAIAAHILTKSVAWRPLAALDKANVHRSLWPANGRPIRLLFDIMTPQNRKLLHVACKNWCESTDLTVARLLQLRAFCGFLESDVGWNLASPWLQCQHTRNELLCGRWQVLGALVSGRHMGHCQSLTHSADVRWRWGKHWQIVNVRKIHWNIQYKIWKYI